MVVEPEYYWGCPHVICNKMKEKWLLTTCITLGIIIGNSTTHFGAWVENGNTI